MSATLEENSAAILQAMASRCAAADSAFADFHAQCQKAHTKRGLIVKGQDEESNRLRKARAAAKAAAAADGADDNEEDEEEDLGVPRFWLTAMKNHPVIAEKISKDDEDEGGPLMSLQDISCTINANGFKLDFFFEPNEFFSNRVLSKTYKMGPVGGKQVLVGVEGTDIQWKGDKNYTVKMMGGNKKDKKGGKQEKKPKQKKLASFFHFFSPPKAAAAGADDDDEDDHQQHSKAVAQERIEDDFEQGVAFKEEIVPFAYMYFTDADLLGHDRDFGSDDFDLTIFPAEIQSRLKSLKDLQETVLKFRSNMLDKQSHAIGTNSSTFQKLYDERRALVADEVRAKPDSDFALFWLTAIRNHPELRGFVRKGDLDVLAYLRDITTIEAKGNNTVEFLFEKNPYFAETKLTKAMNTATHPTKPPTWSEGKDVSAGKPRRGFFSLFYDGAEAHMHRGICQLLATEVVPHAYELFKKGPLDALSDDDSADEAADAYQQELARAQDREDKRKKIGSASKKAEKSPPMTKQYKIILFVVFMISAEIIMFFSGLGMHGPGGHRSLHDDDEM